MRASLSPDLASFSSLGFSAIESFHVGDHQFGVDGVDIGNRVNGVADMGNVAILKTTNHMGDGVHLTDVAEKLVAQSFSLGCSLDESCDVDKLPWSWEQFYRP